MRLKELKKLRKTIDAEISELTYFLKAKGKYPVQPDLRPRDQAIHQRWLAGASMKEIAKQFNLSITRVSTIINRAEYAKHRSFAY